jgi:hypothetical protein
VASLALAACADGGGSGPAGASGDADATADAPLDTQAPEPEMLGRLARRMTVAQLRASIPVLTGGIVWIEDFGQGPVDMLQVLAPTLGQPDYRLVTTESLDPNLIVAKFTADIATSVCPAWIAAEATRAEADRTFLAHSDFDSVAPEDVRATLRWLSLWLHGRAIADGEDGALASLETLFGDAASAAAPGFGARDGWTAVCMGMLTDPGFILY